MPKIRSKQPHTALIRARHRRVLERKQVSWLLGYKGTQVVAAYERGEYLPSLQNAIRISLIYGCEVEDLVPEVYEVAREELLEKTVPSSIIPHDRISELLRGIHRCTYEDALDEGQTAQSHRGEIRDHVTRLAKALAQL